MHHPTRYSKSTAVFITITDNHFVQSDIGLPSSLASLLEIKATGNSLVRTAQQENSRVVSGSISYCMKSVRRSTIII